MKRVNQIALYGILAAVATLMFILSTINLKKADMNKEICNSDRNEVIETILSRRSVRKYKPTPVGRDTMQVIADCGINAPNALNRQSWEIRIVDNKEWLEGLSEIVVKTSPMAAEMTKDPSYRNVFRNAPTVAFIAGDSNFSYSPVDCGLLGENMVLAAWSMGIGSVVLGSPVTFFDTPEAAEYYKTLGFSEGYELLFCISFGYADESPEAKPRDKDKVKFID